MHIVKRLSMRVEHVEMWIELLEESTVQTIATVRRLNYSSFCKLSLEYRSSFAMGGMLDPLIR